jgi:predicted tellurium resistance membrane protein TerC
VFQVDFLSVADLVKLLEVVFVNLVLSADNAIVVGIAAAGLPAHQRLRVVAIGIAGATVLRIAFAGAVCCWCGSAGSSGASCARGR